MGSSQSVEQATEEQAQETPHDPTADPIFLSSSFLSAYQKRSNEGEAPATSPVTLASRQFSAAPRIETTKTSLPFSQEHETRPTVPQFVFPKYQYGDEVDQPEDQKRKANVVEDAPTAAAPSQADMELEIEERLTDRFYQEQIKIAQQQLEKLEMKLQTVAPGPVNVCAEHRAAVLECLQLAPMDVHGGDETSHESQPLLRCRDAISLFSQCVSSAMSSRGRSQIDLVPRNSSVMDTLS